MPTRTNLLAAGGATSSASFTVDAGAPATINIYGKTNRNNAAYVQLEMSPDGNVPFYPIQPMIEPGEVIIGPGYYRISRHDNDFVVDVVK